MAYPAGSRAQTSYLRGFPGFSLLFVACIWGSRRWELPRGARGKCVGTTGGFALSLGLLVFCNACWTARVADLPRWQQQQVRRFPQAVLATGATLRFFAEQGTLGDRLEAAQALRHSGTQAIAPLVRPFFERLSLLSGLPVAPCPHWGQAVVAGFMVEALERISRAEYRTSCASVIFENPDVLICSPKSEVVAQELTIAQCGPQETAAGAVPQPQPHGDGAFWFLLQRRLRHKPPLFRLADGQVTGYRWRSGQGGWFSVGFPPYFVATPRRVQLELLEACQRRSKTVGFSSFALGQRAPKPCPSYRQGSATWQARPVLAM